MSNYEHDHDHESSLAINVPDSSWETYDPFICLGINETMLYTQADIETYNALSAFVQQQDVIMGNDGFEAEAGPESSRAPSGTELCRSGQADALVALSSNIPQGPGETETIPHTDEDLSMALNQITSTINQFGAISQTLGNKIEGLNSLFDDMAHSLDSVGRRLDSMEHRLDSMEHRMDSMKHNMDKLSQGTESLEAKFRTVNEYLLEVIRREQMVMQEFGDLANRYQEQET
ncbi:hypothetical protein N7505_010996 [Penicillium chrysogenum]|uniref:t-SNARE coiled-coil homology domain-containing protein n=1 Tax=Penicillium chrysogenum TaxID=5076 RepID=A0ABQ8W587_PENCH|nr:hypothetical protein N7505_010996 [Penicillium chrysogenum]